MPPALALFVWLVLLVLLLRYDPATDRRTSPALSLALIWMLILGSRLPSQWLGPTATSTTMAFEEGEPLDRAIYFVLIALSF